MPVFRYALTANSALNLLSPLPDSRIAVKQSVRFSWEKVNAAQGYKLEVKDRNRVVLSAVLGADKTSYTAPPWLKQQTNKSLTWQIQALDRNGAILTESESRQFQILR